MRGRTVLLLVALSASGCGDTNAALGQVAEAQRLSADLLYQFTKAADASNRAVMADTDALSKTFADEAESSKTAISRDLAQLQPLLDALHYDTEGRLLQQFTERFGVYQALDRRVLDLAVENTNLTAQRLSFGTAQTAVDEFVRALERAVPRGDAAGAWRIRALTADAIASVRDVQVLQAAHIADPSDTVMDGLETRMQASMDRARRDLVGLTTASSDRASVTDAAAALDRFVQVNVTILTLSRRNTNVRSLALSLDDKRTAIAPCDESARALHDALSKHGYPARR